MASKAMGDMSSQWRTDLQNNAERCATGQIQRKCGANGETKVKDIHSTQRVLSQGVGQKRGRENTWLILHTADLVQTHGPIELFRKVQLQ